MKVEPQGNRTLVPKRMTQADFSITPFLTSLARKISVCLSSKCSERERPEKL